MSYFSLRTSNQLYYEDQGQGQVVVFIHGLWASSRVFHKQLPYFIQRYRTIALDLRGHGLSPHVQSGHTVPIYAQDVRALMQELRVTDAVLVGHSMGALIVWDYLKQFGADNVKATVVIDQPASDFRWPDWPFGPFDFSALCQMMADVQTDQRTMVKEALPMLFHSDPDEDDINLVFEDMMRLPPSIACAILFNQTVQDYREMVSSIAVPTLLCFGGAGEFLASGARDHLHGSLPNSRLVVFENSGHMVTLEEPDRFNREVDQFIQSLG